MFDTCETCQWGVVSKKPPPAQKPNATLECRADLPKASELSSSMARAGYWSMVEPGEGCRYWEKKK